MYQNLGRSKGGHFDVYSIPRDELPVGRKLVIAGGRDIYDWGVFGRAIRLVKNPLECILVCGMCEEGGVDLMGYEWAIANDRPIIECPALWKNLTVKPCKVKYNRAGYAYNALAGPNRNKLMASHANELLLIWDGQSSGSKSMRTQAGLYNLKITEWKI
jgi:hypothetical protein